MTENSIESDLKEIVAQYGVLVSSISHRMIQDKEIAKEAAQEVWYEIIRSIGSFNGQSELSTWIYTISQRTILRYARQERVATMKEWRRNIKPSGRLSALSTSIRDSKKNCHGRIIGKN